MSHNQNAGSNEPGHIQVKMILRNTGDVRRAVALGNQLLQRVAVECREMCWGDEANAACTSLCVGVSVCSCAGISGLI